MCKFGFTVITNPVNSFSCNSGFLLWASLWYKICMRIGAVQTGLIQWLLHPSVPGIVVVDHISTSLQS